MPRIKPAVVGKINNHNEADEVLMQIGSLTLDLEAIDAEADTQITRIKDKAATDGKSIRQKIDELSQMLGAFSEYNKADLFRDRKSVDLTFGVFGYRKSTSIHVKKSTLEILKEKGMTEYIRVKEEPNKEAMAAMSDESLATVDAKRIEKDDFFCESKRDAVNSALLKKGA
jgi:phage host-nuclease inhibitor protein Gam